MIALAAATVLTIAALVPLGAALSWPPAGAAQTAALEPPERPVVDRTQDAELRERVLRSIEAARRQRYFECLTRLVAQLPGDPKRLDDCGRPPETTGGTNLYLDKVVDPSHLGFPPR